MDYSLNERELKFASDEQKKLFVATLVCQKDHISFGKLCKLMAEDSTVGESDVVAVFYKFIKVVNFLCSQGYIVDAGPLGTFRPAIQSKAVAKAEDFKPSEHIRRIHITFTPSAEFKLLKGVEFHRVPKQERKKKTPAKPKP
ncbi:HU family DNA-binding protein [Hoylesella enoeca]|uniref:HU family DNA-binding protein n=1 Tax=Hoylesella enoeca TaxID=76123 RepID=UPI00288A4765|nr:DNA-binding protein [Hoylesella enoeca]